MIDSGSGDAATLQIAAAPQEALVAIEGIGRKRVDELFRMAIRRNAASIVIAHNHPSGDPTPSSEDIRVTRELVKAGKLLSIDVVDHIVVGGHKYVSMRERGLGFS